MGSELTREEFLRHLDASHDSIAESIANPILCAHDAAQRAMIQQQAEEIARLKVYIEQLEKGRDEWRNVALWAGQDDHL